MNPSRRTAFRVDGRRRAATRLSSGLLIALGVALWVGVAEAHKPSDSYLTLRQDGDRLVAQWDIALRDLDYAIGLDADGDGAITWRELRARHDAIAAYALARLQVEVGGSTCSARPAAQLVDIHSDGAYTVLRFDLDCPRARGSLNLRYSLFFDFDPQHRGVLRIEGTGKTPVSLLTREQPNQRVQVAASGPWQTSREFWRDGIRQLWIGYDHTLFLLAMLLPVVLVRSADRWRAVPSFRRACVETFKIVAAFAVAHSITLSLASMGAIHLPSRLVQSAIAASVVVAAIGNATRLLAGRRWTVAFGFGLLHGIGLAGVLAEGLPGSSSALALLGFNAGIETGQLAIVGAFLPIAYALRRSWTYQRLTLSMGSCAIAGVGVVWLAERALNLRLLPL